MMNESAPILPACREGHALPSAFYGDHKVFDLEIDRIFSRRWLFACTSAELPKRGAFVTLQIGPYPILIVRADDGTVRAFHNVCRHRGSVLCAEERGDAPLLVCRYHSWSYSLNGALVSAREPKPGFCKDDHALLPVAAEMVAGLVYINLTPGEDEFEGFKKAVTPFLAPHELENTKVAHAETTYYDANWKLIIENNRECYHCRSNHPELMRTMYEFSHADDPRGDEEFNAHNQERLQRFDALGLPHKEIDGGPGVRCIRIPLRKGVKSFTEDGELACRRLLASLPEPELGSVRLFRAPNNWNHILSDHSIHFRVLPISPTRSALRTTWLVHKDAVEGRDYDVARLTEVWVETNRQDGDLAVGNQRGVLSPAYRPGPYTAAESMTEQFLSWYYAAMGIVPAPAHAL